MIGVIMTLASLIVAMFIVLFIYCREEDNWLPFSVASAILGLSFLLCMAMAPTTEEFCEEHNINYELVELIAEMKDLPIDVTASTLHYFGEDAFEFTEDELIVIKTLIKEEK